MLSARDTDQDMQCFGGKNVLVGKTDRNKQELK